MKPHDPFRPDLPPPPFVPPFVPPGSQSPYILEGSSTDEGNNCTTASSDDDFGPRPDWWPEDWPWPPEPEEPVVLEAYPPNHTWPRLPPDHHYHVPTGYPPPTASHPASPANTTPTCRPIRLCIQMPFAMHRHRMAS